MKIKTNASLTALIAALVAGGIAVAQMGPADIEATIVDSDGAHTTAQVRSSEDSPQPPEEPQPPAVAPPRQPSPPPVAVPAVEVPREVSPPAVPVAEQAIPRATPLDVPSAIKTDSPVSPPAPATPPGEVQTPASADPPPSIDSSQADPSAASGSVRQVTTADTQPVSQSGPPPAQQLGPDGEPLPPPPPAQIGGVQAADGEIAATWIKGMPLNDLFAVLARKIGYQYFSNPELASITVNGQLYDEVGTLEQFNDIGMQYGVTIYARGNTIYALTEDQLAMLPRTEWTYKLKYLNIHTPQERESLDSLLRPALSSRGALNYEPMTRTLVVMDNEHSVRTVASLLEKIDKPQKQVIVKVQILRLLNNAGSKIGVDWANSLGDGINVGVTAYGPIDRIFNTAPLVGGYGQLADTVGDAVRDAIYDGTASPTSGEFLPAPASPLENPTGLAARAYQSGALPAGVVLNPLEISAVIRALIEKDQAVQESGPTVIIKDNQAGSFSIVELIPIITSTATQSDGVTLITSQVSYQIDPERGTYVGLQVALRPSVLPDNTIEMLLQPRIATVTGYEVAETGIEGVANRYPLVNETSVDSIARIPDGYSLVLSGYYQVEEREIDNKVPLLGDIPGLSFAFRSKSRQKIRSNILFVLTPTTYDPQSSLKTVKVSEMIRQNVKPPKRIDYPDDEMPGEDTSPNFLQRIRNMLPFNSKKNRNPNDTQHPDYARPEPEIVTEQQANQRAIEQRMRESQKKEEVLQ